MKITSALRDIAKSPRRLALEGPSNELKELAAQQEAISQKGIKVRRELRPAAVSGSETLLARMVGNLIDNATRHNEEGGWIGVRTEVEGLLRRIVVESGGAVLDETRVQRLTQPFERLGAERTGSDGSVRPGL